MTHPDSPTVAAGQRSAETETGAAMAAVLASGFGAFAVGLFVILNEVGILPAPTLYGPAGAVSGRTTLAVASWLVAWGILHRRWNGRHVEAGGVLAATVVLTLLGLIGTFPPVWGIF